MNIKDLTKDLKNLDISLGGGGDISFCDILFFIFLVLKLMGIVNWSWWIIFIPLIAEFGLMFIALLIFIFVIAGRVDEKANDDIE